MHQRAFCHAEIYAVILSWLGGNFIGLNFINSLSIWMLVLVVRRGKSFLKSSPLHVFDNVFDCPAREGKGIFS